MTARTPLDTRTLEILSAYLDGRLSDNEKTALENRLERDSSLRVHLEELRAVRDRLRALPILRSPRALTLTPAMVGEETKSRGLPSWPMAFGSALAALAFLFLVSRDLLVGRTTSMTAVPALFQLPMSAQMESGRSEATAAGAQDLQMMPTVMFALPAPTQEAAPSEPILKTVEETPTEQMVMETPAPSEPSYGVGGGGPTETPAPTVAPAEEIITALMENAVGGETPPAGTAPGEVSRTLSETAKAEGEVAEAKAAFNWETLIPEIEVSLLLAAILLGALAVRNARGRH